MPQDAAAAHEATREEGHSSPRRARDGSGKARDWRDRIGVPEPVKKVFSKFPLVTYGENSLPITSPRRRDEHCLWIWTTPEGAEEGALSFNPTCLKWQVYLKFRNVSYRTLASNNHASPSGSLPFLTAAEVFTRTDKLRASPIPSSKIRNWALEQNSQKDDHDLPLRAETYMALIDDRIRRAWLYMLYLDKTNFAAVACRLYVQPSSSNLLVNSAIAYQLRKAAQDELSKTNPCVDAEELMIAATEAFEALSTLLGEDEWFFAQTEPGLFDASLFAYTYLLLDENMGWQRNELDQALISHANLVQHRDRILSRYFL
ncbi:hypothetical protein AAFC00_004792 [Neodothiora populina]|uniref:Mitochondrial outer membrane protein n=1 Tax=Neodothiora populina TaxID=2781224 RepID=A0ABR3P3H1_9PEZI